MMIPVTPTGIERGNLRIFTAVSQPTAQPRDPGSCRNVPFRYLWIYQGTQYVTNV
jgi:hypothetical protein